MKKIARAIHHFFQELRHADMKTRKRWRALLSGASMLLVIALWVLYSKVAFPSYDTVATETAAPATQLFATTTASEKTPPTSSSAGGSSILDTFGRGLAVFGKDLQNGVRAVGDAVRSSFERAAANFRKTNSFEVRTPTSTEGGTSTAPEPIPPTPLP